MISNEELYAYVRKNPIVVGCAVVALACGVVQYLRSGAAAEAEQLLEEKAAEGRRLALNLRYAAQLPEQLAQVTAAMAEIQPRLVHADELAKNLQYFYKLEAETGTKLIDLRQMNTPGQAKAGAKGAFSSVAFNLSLQGEYTALLKFLRQLESGAHYCRVITAGATLGNPDRTGPVSLQLTVELLGRP